MLNEIANLEKTQADSKKDDDAKKIKKGIAKAKETGFILPDDKQGEEWLTNILSADFDGTMQKIEAKGKDKKVEKKVITGDEQTKLARELAKQTMTNFY